MEWREVAFSYEQIDDFLSILAMPHYEVGRILPFGSAQQRCFCMGFYFFTWAIRGELNQQLADALLDLAVRAEQASKDSSHSMWDQNAECARAIGDEYFAKPS